MRREDVMNNDFRKQFRYCKASIINYGNLFIDSEGGRNWEKLWRGSSISPIAPFWLRFYYDLETTKFQKSIEDLLSYQVGNYRREQTIEEIKELIDRIKKIEPEDSGNPQRRTHINIERDEIVKFRENIEFLFDNYVIENYPWDENDINEFIILKPVNHDFKEILLDGYYSIINHYENADQQKILELKKEIQGLNKTFQSQNNENRDKSALLTNKIASLEDSLRKLQAENQELKRANQKSHKNENIDEEETPDSIAFILTFLYRMGILDSTVWPKERTDLQIASLLTDLLTLSGRDEINIGTLSRERKRIINLEPRGQKILANNDATVKRIIAKRFPDFDFEKQEFVLKFNQNQNKDMS